MLTKRLLLATLGQSPAVVTEALDYLLREGVDIDAVIVLATKGEEVRQGIELLRVHLPEYYGGRTVLLGERVMGTWEDVDSNEAALEFMRHACSALRDYRKLGYEIYVSIAGGRKAMSALLALAVQFYGAHRLFHVVVKEPQLEVRSSVLKSLPREEQVRLLHPPMEQVRVIELPFIGLFPFLPDILAGLKGEDVREEIRQLLEQNGLLKGRRLTSMGYRVLHILQEVQTPPEPRRERCQLRISVGHNVERLTEWAREIERRFEFVQVIETIDWHGEFEIRTALPNIVTIPVPGIAGVGFRLTTTAQTLGQLQYVRNQLEQWIAEMVRR